MGQTEVLQPLGKPKNKMVWRNVQTNPNFINVKGGFNTKYNSASSIQYRMGTQQYDFVKLCKNETWFLKGVGGVNTKKGDLKAVNVFADIRKRCNTVEDPGTDDDAAAVAEDAQHESDEDPMMALDQVVELKPAPALAPAAEAKAKAKPRGRPKGAASRGEKRVQVQ